MAEISPPKIASEMVKFVLPIALGMIAGYGTVKYEAGQTEQRLTAAENAIKANRDAIDKSVDREVTRDELKIYMDTQTAILNSIQADVRAMRQNGR
jgi:hypothetical protein